MPEQLRNVQRGAAAILLLALSPGCQELPRDPEGTVQEIRGGGTIVLGMVDGVERDPAAERRLAEVARQLGVKIERRADDAEVLLRDLEEGRLHLVYGRFAATSPWSSRVHLGQVPGREKEPPSDERAPRFAYRNGENRWIMTVETARP